MLKPLCEDVADADAVSCVGSVITTVAVVVQPLLFVTVTVYVPATKPVSDCVVAALLQANVFVPEPPAGVTVAVPSLPPLQEILKPLCEEVADADAVSCVGCVIVTDAVVVQPLLFVTVTV